MSRKRGTDRREVIGVFGAALATVISTTVAFVIGFWLLFSGKRGVKPSLKGLLKLDWSIDSKLLSIGLPTGIEMLFPDLIMNMFIDDPEVIALGTTMIRILSLSFLFLAVFFGLGSAFGGAGYMLPFTTSSVISRWGIQVPLLILFNIVLKMPIEHIWIALAVSEISESIIMVLAYRQGKWKTKRV